MRSATTAVKHLVLCRIERRPPKLDLDIYPYLPRANVATTARYHYLGYKTLVGAQMRYAVHDRNGWPLTFVAGRQIGPNASVWGR